MKSHFEYKGENYALDVTPLGEGFVVQFGEQTAEVHFARGADGQVVFILDGRKVETEGGATAGIPTQYGRKVETEEGAIWLR